MASWHCHPESFWASIHIFLLQKQFTHTCFVAKTIYATFFCQKKDSRTLLLWQKQFPQTFLLQKWFTHIVRKVFAPWNLPKFRLFCLWGRPCTVYTSYVLTGFYVLFLYTCECSVWSVRVCQAYFNHVFVYVCVSCIMQLDVRVCLGVHVCVMYSNCVCVNFGRMVCQSPLIIF